MAPTNVTSPYRFEQVSRFSENYTYINGIYSAQISPQFSNSVDNVQQPIQEPQNLKGLTEPETLRFFRIQ